MYLKLVFMIARDMCIFLHQRDVRLCGISSVFIVFSEISDFNIHILGLIFILCKNRGDF